MTRRIVGPGIARRIADAATNASQCSMDMICSPDIPKKTPIHRNYAIASRNFWATAFKEYGIHVALPLSYQMKRRYSLRGMNGQNKRFNSRLQKLLNVIGYTIFFSGRYG
jgi:hypothetical protein